MNKTMKRRILAIVMAFTMAVAFSTTAFADGPQGHFNQDQRMGRPQNGGPQSGMQMNGAPQGNFGQQPPEKPEGDEDRTPPSDGENVSMTPFGNDPINQIIAALNEYEDEKVKTNIEKLMEAHRDAVDAERNAKDDASHAEAAAAVVAAQDALNEALAAAGIEVTLEMPEQSSQQPPERPDGDRPAEGGQPENGQQNSVGIPQNAENTSDLFSLFQQFMKWLKNNGEE